MKNPTFLWFVLIFLFFTSVKTGLHFSNAIFNFYAYSKIILKFSRNRLKTSFFRLLLSALF